MHIDIAPAHVAAQARPGPALARLVLTEARLLIREPVALFWGLAFPMALLAIMGIASSGPGARLGGLPLVAVYEPILIAFVTVAFAIQGLPTVVAGYRERRILRRLATTPVGPVRIIAAQLAINLAVAGLSLYAARRTPAMVSPGESSGEMERPAEPRDISARWPIYVATAISGAWLEGHPLTWLGGDVGPWIGASHAIGSKLAELHGWLGDTILWVAGAHACAALYHHFVLRDAVLRTMLPGRGPLRPS